MGLFDKFKKTEEKKDVYRDKNGIFHFGENSTAKKITQPATKEFLEEYPWSSSKLRFVIAPETEFHANTMNFDLDNNQITFFDGIWNSGPFTGDKFVGEFSGFYFIGNFMGLYSSYKSEPNTFVGGTFQDLSNKGILGKPNTLTLDKLSDNESFNLITVPVGYSIQMRSANGIDSSIKVLKRLDKDSSDFKFEVVDGFTGKKSIIVVDWETIRKAFNSFDVLKKGTTIIGDLIVAKNGDYINEINISKSDYIAEFGYYKDNILRNGETIEFSYFPLLNINKQICFDCFDADDVNPLFDIHNSLCHGTYFTELKGIKALLNAGYVNGYGKYGQLKNIFDGNPGENIDYEKEEVKQIFDFLLKTNLILTNARGKENRELLLQSFKHIIFNNENDAELTSNDPSLIDEIDFSQDERLGVDMKLNFAFSSKKEKEEFEKYKKDVAEGKFYLTLMQTQRFLQNGELLGYHNKLELKPLFGEQGSIEPPASEKAQNCLNYLSQINNHLINTVNPKEDAEKLITIIKLIITDNY